MSAQRFLAVVAWLTVATACTDAGVVTTPTPSRPPLTTSIEPVPANGDPGPQWPTAIHDLGGDILLPWSDEQYPAQATVSGHMRYDSYHARISARANVAGPNSQSYDFYPEERHQFWSFFNNVMHAQWNMHIAGPCGNVVDLDLLGEVWWMYSSGWTIDKKSRNQKVTRRQANCPEPTPGGGIREPTTGGFYRCYTYTVDHYWYYPDTGRYEYRYTSESSWCEYYET